MPGKPTYFASPAAWRAWLAKHHASKPEVLVGFWKRDTGKPSITWPESVDEALCYGWIDGIRRSLGAEAYTIRFTPRKSTSNWSAVNIRRMAVLEKEGRVAEAGRKAFAARQKSKSQIYAYEQDRRTAVLSGAYLKQFKADRKAWTWYQQHPEWYQRQVAWRIMSAKKPETRARLLARYLDECRHQRTVKEIRAAVFPGVK